MQQAELQRQVAVGTLDHKALQQASQLQQQLQDSVHEQRQLSQKLNQEWKEHTQTLTAR